MAVDRNMSDLHPVLGKSNKFCH